MQTIPNLQTLPGFDPTLTINRSDWEAIEVSISDAAVTMQLLDKDGASLDEITVDPGALSLGTCSGVRFRTNPATPTLPGTVFAIARHKGEPAIEGLKPRDTLPTIFGPKLFDGQVSIPPGAGLTTMFTSPIPGNWASLLIKVAVPTTGWHFQAQWSHGQTPIQNFDFYCDGGVIAIPIIGDTLTLVARHVSGAAQVVTAQAYLTNFAPFSVWARSEWRLLYGSNIFVGGGGGITTVGLPLFAGNISVTFTTTGGSALTAGINGLDEAGALLSIPWEDTAVPDNATTMFSALVAPHRNVIVFKTNGAPDETVHDLTIIGQRT